MRIARFRVLQDQSDTTPGFGLVEGEGEGLAVAEIAGHPFASFSLTGRRFPLAEVRLLAPIIPTKVVCIGKNYAEHAAEMGGEAPERPLVFLKPSTTVVGPGDPVLYPRDSERVDYEGELAVVIGRLARDLTEDTALDAVFGYTCANDVTARDQQLADGQWTRGKGHDTFCPLGPWIETDLDTSDLEVRTELDNEVKQLGRTKDLVHGIPALLAHITSCMTLLPGDVVLTGTPAGVGPMLPGQLVSVTIEGIGSLYNVVMAR